MAGGGGNVYQQAYNGLNMAGQGTVQAFQQAGAPQITPALVNPQGYRAQTIGGTSYTSPTATSQGYAAAQAGSQGYDPTMIQGPQTIASQMATYQNPYTSQVIDASLSDLDRQRQIVQQQNESAAAAAGAFGGSRHGVLGAETNRAFADEAGQLAAGLRADGFNTAAGLAAQDVANDFAGQQFNANAANTAGQFGANAANIASLANAAANDSASAFTAQAANDTSRFNTGLKDAQRRYGADVENSALRYNADARTEALQFGRNAQNRSAEVNASALNTARATNAANALTSNAQRLAAADQLAGIAGQGFGMGQEITATQAAQGAQQQAAMQAVIDAIRGQVSGFTGNPGQSLQYPIAALGASPAPQSSSTSQSPGLFNILGGLLSL